MKRVGHAESSRKRMESKPEEKETTSQFVRWTKLPIVLGQALGDGVSSALIMRPDGVLLSVAGQEPDLEKILAGVGASVFKSFRDEGNACLGTDQLETVLVDCEGGSLLMNRIGKFVLVLFAKKPVKLSLIMSKVWLLFIFVLIIKTKALLENLRPLNEA